MVNYFLLTYILSVVGGLFYYFFIRKSTRPQLQKALLLSIVVLSFALPPIIDSFFVVETEEKVCLHKTEYISETVSYNFCPAPGEEMDMCLDIALKEEHFCECTSILPNNLLVYKAKPVYDFWFVYGSLLTNILKSIAFVLFVFLFLKIAYLWLVIVQSEKEEMEIEGKIYTILHPQKSLSVGSFKLWKEYIIWQKELDYLTETERMGVLWHEIAHLEQKDTWLKIGFELLQLIWWMNPVFYLFSKELDKLNEFLADEFAVEKVGNTQFYATLLVKMKRYQNLSMVHHFKAQKEHPLKLRVLHLLNQKQVKSSFKYLTSLLIGIVFSVLSLTAYFAIPNIDEQMDHITFYEELSIQQQASGKSIFCKSCLLKNLQ
ncbi:MAG: M56 family metallopeptidase [Chitinophagales bacterium]